MTDAIKVKNDIDAFLLEMKQKLSSVGKEIAETLIPILSEIEKMEDEAAALILIQHVTRGVDNLSQSLETEFELVFR
jgi:hypothetical protein